MEKGGRNVGQGRVMGKLQRDQGLQITDPSLCQASREKLRSLDTH